MIDCSKGVQYLNEIKDSVIAGFQWATKEVGSARLIKNMIMNRKCILVFRNLINLFVSHFVLLVTLLT